MPTEHTLAENLLRLQSATEDIADAITEKGGTASYSDGLEAMGDKVRAIPSGGGTSYTQMDTDDVDGVAYSSMSQDGMVISPKDLAYISAYVSGNILGDDLPSNANLNDYYGIDYEFRSYYYGSAPSSMTGVPSGLTGGFSLKCVHVDVGHFMQILVPYDTSKPRFYIRQTGGSTWSDWQEIADNTWSTVVSDVTFGSESSQNGGRHAEISTRNYKNGVAEPTATAKIFYVPYGNSSNSGFVKLSDSTSSTAGTSDRTAATPSAVKLAFDVATTAGSMADSAYTAATTNADSGTYGRVMLSASTSSTSGTSGGYAATPSAVRSAYNLADSAYDLAYDKMDKPTFISSLLFTSKISSYYYAFSVFNGIAVLNFTAEVGSSISSGSAITILTSSGYIPSSYRPPYSVGFLANVYNSSSGKYDFVSMYVHTNGAMYVRPTTAIAVGDTIRGSVTWTYSSSAWETG